MRNSFKLRNLSIAALVGLAGFGATNSAQANETPITPTLGDDASYTLNEISTPTDNSITLYKYDNTGITEAINYEINLKQTTYGEGDTSKYYNWTKDDNGNYTLVESTNGSGDVVFKYDSTKTQATGRHYYGSNDDPNYTINENFISLPTNSNGNAIFNDGHINKITADFIDINALPVYGTNTTAYYGLVISNDWSSGAVINSIEGNFVGNKATALQVYGGAIYNGTDAEIKNINANFIANGATSDVAGYVYGGAIYNKGTIGNITGDFIGNYAHRYNQYNNEAKGGAIYNEAGSIGDINANFVGNYVKNDVATANGAYGGAIYNIATIGNITGDFIANYVSSAKKTEGSAIYNTGTIGNITGDFIGNYSTGGASTSASVIYNSGTIGDITANFIGNTGNYLIYNDGYYSHPGALGGIKGNFIGNHAVGGLIKSDDYATMSGIIDVNFIDNTVDKGDIFSISPYYTSTNEFSSFTANFINNTVLSDGSYLGNGTILILWGKASIDTMNLQFIGNKSCSSIFAMGDAISINDLKASFINNSYNKNDGSGIAAIMSNIENAEFYFESNEGVALDLYNARIKNLKAEFVNNFYLSENNSAVGGAMVNSIGTYSSDYEGDECIDNFEANFIGNYTKSVSKDSFAGALYNWGTIKSLKGDFIGNHSISESGVAASGAIHNAVGDCYSDWSGLSSITASSNFIGNYAESVTGDVFGGAISNISNWMFYRPDGYGYQLGLGQIDIQGDLLQNHVSSTEGNAVGGALFVKGVIYDSFVEELFHDYSGNLITGSVTLGEVSILNEDGTVYKSLTVPYDTDVDVDYLDLGVLKNAYKKGYVEILVESNVGESISKAEFDAMLEAEDMTEEQFLNLASREGIIVGSAEDFINNLANTKIFKLSANDVRSLGASVTLKNSNIVDNFAQTKSNSSMALGGAIFVVDDNVKIIANNGETSLISGNYTKTGDVIDDNAIYMLGGKLVFDVTNGSTIQLDDNINGTGLRLDYENGYVDLNGDNIIGDNYEVYIVGDQQSKFILNNKIKNSTTHLIDTNLYLTKDTHLDGNHLGLHSGMLNMINNQAGVSALNSLTVTGDTNVNVDVDLKNQTMDRFTASEYGSHSGNLNVTGMNLLSDAVNDTTEILFAEQGLKDNVTNGITSQLPDDKYQTTLFTPIYKYNVSYDNREDAGYFVFTGGPSSASNDSSVFNPAVLGSSTSATVGATATMNQAFNYAFQNSADYMNIPYLERISMRDRNKYAISVTGDATDMGRFSPLYQPSQEGASVWVKPYATFETVGLKNGPKVHNNTYGTLIGFDTEMQSIKRGWDRVFTGYIGYNGASQRYSGIDSTQNGGLLGGTMTLYKGNFFNATTVSVGASVANNQTMYGNEDFAMLLSGIGNKTGYNFEFKEGKLILQPSMLMSYTFVNTFDYTNAAGVRIDNKPLHALQLAPGVKVIGNLKNGWQPYASVQMVWNLMGESNATANGVKLPEMSIKPYVQYGVGVQKRIKDHFTAYGQAMVQNGGRNGVSLTAGFRWALGHDNCKYKVEDKQLRNNAAKQLRSDAAKQLRSDVVISSNNAIATPSARNDNGRKILKQMTPQQRAAYGGKYYNTTRTAKSGSLRQY